jgi:hypothetical protein
MEVQLGMRTSMSTSTEVLGPTLETRTILETAVAGSR